jgi:hypothetical protein
MISGRLPRFQRWYHLCVSGFMCLLFAGLGVMGSTVCIAGLMGVGPNPVAYVVFGAPFAAFAVWAIISQVRSLRGELVREFSYDGRVLRFRTIASSEEQVRELCEIAEVREGRSSRSPPTGYLLRFRDGRRLVLDYWLQNVVALAVQLRTDLGLL